MLKDIQETHAPAPIARRDDFTLDDKYLRENGVILLSGTQALLRLAIDQHRADAHAGLNTATLISGYRGSPLGGLDMLLDENPRLLEQYQIQFTPGLNEDLAATAIFGAQMANLLPNPKYDGVLGMWYGKGPGVDRTGDAFRHANYAGVGKYGGVLALAGDDPSAKSSTIPSASEVALYDALMPTLYPGSVQEILDYGRLGFELSRYSGLWVGFKIVTNVADEYSTAEVSTERITITRPDFTYKDKPWQAAQNPALITPFTLNTEREMIEGRWEAARQFGAVNNLNKIVLRTSDDWIGIVAAGKTYYDVRQAFHDLGLDDETLRRYGVRLLKIGLLSPLDASLMREFARGLQEIFVIEEKRAFVEHFIREALYNLSERPRIIGKRDENDALFVPGSGELDSDTIARLLAARLRARIPEEFFQPRLTQTAPSPLPMVLPLLARKPYFCSGCPHNTSTTSVPDGSLVGAGIGCHTMAMLMERPAKNITGVTQMGGEGAQWVGASPFTEVPHIFQNIGDGTLFHSGTLAIRQAVAANAHITYKILWNSAVAMTGGQQIEAQMPVWRLTHLLRAEGVTRIIVTTRDPDDYPPDADWATAVDVWHRDRIEEAQTALRDTPGVTVLIHDQECAAELRRKRRRGLAPDPELRVFINESVCEGCGDCGVKSNCLSVFPVETEYGRKTQIHQSSCNKDYSCLKGHCPAFVTVVPAAADTQRSRPFYDEQFDLPEPESLTNGEANLFLMGIGGTGVVTINQIIATAAAIDGKYITSLDQTGLSQKGGPVVSHLRIMNARHDIANKIAAGQADGYLVFDLLTGTDFKNLSRANNAQTVAVVSTSEVPTGDMIASTGVRWPSNYKLHQLLDEHTRADLNVYFDAIGLSETLFGTHMTANMMVVGAAYQRGLIPVSAEALERAIELNGVAIKANLQAFRVGRRIVAEPDWKPETQAKRATDLQPAAEISSEAQALIDSVGADGELLRLLRIRVPELIAYQNTAYAREYVDFVKRVRTREQALPQPETGSALSEAVARYLFKLMAYKDEYEVARLHLKTAFKGEIAAQFGTSAKVTYLLQPPLLRSVLKGKIKLGRWFDTVYRLLTTLRFLRGTPFDIFGYDQVRRTERALIGQYKALIEETLNGLTAENYAAAVKLAALPDMIRGYDHIKLANVEKFRAEVEELKKG